MLKIAGVVNDSIVDGPGLRFTIFFQGCPHHCPGCHNPETWDFQGGMECTPQQLIETAKRNPLCRGITLSGGEPFAQAGEELIALIHLAKDAGYEVASYTGYTFEALLEQGTPAQKEMLSLLDVLIDGPFLQEQLTLELRFRGSKNQRILNVPHSLAQGKAVWEQTERWVGSPE